MTKGEKQKKTADNSAPTMTLSCSDYTVAISTAQPTRGSAKHSAEFY